MQYETMEILPAISVSLQTKTCHRHNCCERLLICATTTDNTLYCTCDSVQCTRAKFYVTNANFWEHRLHFIVIYNVPIHAVKKRIIINLIEYMYALNSQ